MSTSFKPSLLAGLMTCMLWSGMANAHQPTPETISVQGSGTVQYQPDRAVISFAIEAREKTVSLAQQKAAEVASAVLSMTKKLKIPRKRVDTSGVSLRPNYVWNREQNENVLRGYIANRNMSVTLHDLDQLGDVIEGGIEAGVNTVSPPTMHSSKRAEHHRAALAAAADDARKNAEAIASALGLKLGPALNVSTSQISSNPGPRPMMRAQAMEADAGASYNVGEDEAGANVNVVFAIESNGDS